MSKSWVSSGRVRSKLRKAKQGFTIIEVSIFLALTGLLLVGALAGTYSAIAQERYNDSVRSFAEYFRQIYAEVISPESLGSGNLGLAIYGKVIVFGLESPDDDDSRDQDNTVYSATLVGDVDPVTADSFIAELGAINAHLFCGSTTATDEYSSTVSTYTPLWGAKIHNTANKPFRGTIIIARAPNSGTIHATYTEEQFNIKESCSPDDQSASTALATAITERPTSFTSSEDVNLCLESENSTIVRNIRLTAFSRNTSAVSVVSDDPEETKCQRD